MAEEEDQPKKYAWRYDFEFAAWDIPTTDAVVRSAFACFGVGGHAPKITREDVSVWGYVVYSVSGATAPNLTRSDVEGIFAQVSAQVRPFACKSAHPRISTLGDDYQSAYPSFNCSEHVPDEIVRKLEGVADVICQRRELVKVLTLAGWLYLGSPDRDNRLVYLLAALAYAAVGHEEMAAMFTTETTKTTFDRSNDAPVVSFEKSRVLSLENHTCPIPSARDISDLYNYVNRALQST